jgi:NADH-quinone oxidoreductase subunit L
MIQHSWVIPAVSVAAFVLTLFFGTRLPKRGAELCIAAAIATFALSAWDIVQWITGARIVHESTHTWFHLGPAAVQFGTIDDGLTAMMLGVVATISLLVQIFSTSYMHQDRRYTHYFAVVSLFTAAMQWFTISADLLQAIIGWEVMGLCSFLLIGHWWEEKRNVHAAMKAFLTTRASDAGMILGIIILFFATHSFQMSNINNVVLAGHARHELVLLGATALFIAVIGKCAQFPLHTWLPDAMAGPTPISALIHAATMVVAGVYLMARLFPVFAKAFSIGPLAHTVGGLNPIALIGAITIVIAALLAFVQTDIKKLLSYSTVSQLGYMVMAMGVGAWTAGTFHLFTHALFKALLFLTSGCISHTVHGFDIEEDMGGLRKRMPVTHATFAIGAAALVGVIPLAGFWSKEQIVAQAGANGYGAFEIVGLVGTFLTAAYMMRCYYFVFMGNYRGHAHPQEAPAALTGPCIVLAVLSIFGGFLQAPALGIHLFADWVAPSYLGHASNNASIALPFTIELSLAAAGIALAIAAFAFNFGPRQLASRFKSAKAVYHVLYNRYYLDWLYERIFVHGIRRCLSVFVHRADVNLIDGTVKDVAAVTEGSGALLSRAHTGRVQRYIGAMFVSVAVIAFLLTVGH